MATCSSRSSKSTAFDSRQLGLIGRINLLHDAAQRIAGLGLILVWRDEIVLGPTDGAGDRLGRGECRIDVQLVHRPPQGRRAVARIVDRVVFLQADERGVFPQHAGRRSGETCRSRPRCRAPAAATRSRISSAALLVNVRARIWLPGTPSASMRAMRCVTTRVLPLPGPARIKQRAVVVQDRLALGFGEVFQKVFHRKCRSSADVWMLILSFPVVYMAHPAEVSVKLSFPFPLAGNPFGSTSFREKTRPPADRFAASSPASARRYFSPSCSWSASWGSSSASSWLIVPEWRANHDFVETTCTIIDRRIVEVQGKKGTLYRPEIQIKIRVKANVSAVHLRHSPF